MQVEYDFQYYPMEMPTDIPVLVLSHAKSRLLPCDVTLPVRTRAVPVEVQGSEEDTGLWRQYFSHCKFLEHEISDDMKKVGGVRKEARNLWYF